MDVLLSRLQFAFATSVYYNYIEHKLLFIIPILARLSLMLTWFFIEIKVGGKPGLLHVQQL